MAGRASPNDPCVNPGCGHPRWRHRKFARGTGYCRVCLCKRFRALVPSLEKVSYQRRIRRQVDR